MPPGRLRIRSLPTSAGILPPDVTSRFLSRAASTVSSAASSAAISASSTMSAAASTASAAASTASAAAASTVSAAVSSASLLESYAVPLQSELWSLILCEVGFLLATILAGWEAWSTRIRPHPTGGGTTTAMADGRGGQGRMEEGQGGGAGTPPQPVPPPHRQQQQPRRHTNRRGSNDTDDRGRSPAGAGVGGGSASAAAATPSAANPPSSSNATSTEQTPSSNKKIPQRSSGDSTRRAFFQLIFLALLCRFVLLPVQAFYFAPVSADIHPDTGLCMSSAACIFSRTLPDLAFASAFSLLVLFYAQLAGTASGGGPRGLTYILTRKRLFPTANIVMYATYGFLFFFTAVVPLLPYALFQTIVWSMLCLVYLLLLCLLSYFGPVLVNLLRPSLARRSALAYRLIAMCIICTVVFLSRTVCFGIAVWQTDYRWTRGILSNAVAGAPSASSEDEGGSKMSQFDQNVLGYTLLELLPSLAILAMMHQSSPARGGSSTSPSAAAGTTPPTGTGSGGGMTMGGGSRGQQQQQHSPASHDGGRVGGGGGGMRRIPSGSAPKRVASARAAIGMGGGGSGGMGMMASPSEGVALLGDRGAASAAASGGGAYGTTGMAMGANP